MWWQKVSEAIENFIKNCSQCLKSYISPNVLLLSSSLPRLPWQKIAADLFKLNKTHYLLIVDYFFRFHEVLKLTSTTSCSIVIALKFTFTRHGIPSILFTDNGPHFSSQNFKEFTSAYSFCPQSAQVPSKQWDGGNDSRDCKNCYSMPLTRFWPSSFFMLNYSSGVWSA